MIVIEGSAPQFWFAFNSKISILWPLNSNLRVNSWQSEDTVRRKAEAVQVNLLSLDTRISNS